MTIAETNQYITITEASGLLVRSFPKAGLELDLNGEYIRFLYDGSEAYRLLWSNVTSPVVTSASNLHTTLLGYANNVGQVLQVFTATAGQTTFTPTFTATSSSKVYVGGALTVSGWTAVGGAVVFAVGLLVGTEVVIIA